MEVALVTGATSGIGLAISKKLIERGFIVRGLARQADQCAFKNERFHATHCDVTDLSALEKTVDQIAAKYDAALKTFCP